MTPDPHEQAVEAARKALYLEGASFGGITCGIYEGRDVARIVIKAALPHLEQERPDPKGVWGCDAECSTWSNEPEEAGAVCRECGTVIRWRTAPQDNPPSRAGEVAEELLALADSDDWHENPTTTRTLRRLADKLTEQEPSREELGRLAIEALLPLVDIETRGKLRDALSEKGRE